MIFRLALALGWPSVAWGLQHISSTELTEWLAFIELEGLPEINAEVRSARALHAFVNAHRDTDQRKSEYPFSEFLPPWLQEERQEPGEEGTPDPQVAALASARMAALSSMFR